MIASARRKWFALGLLLRRAVHGRARHRDRERRPSVHPDRPRVLAGEPPVGRERLRALLRRLPPARRAGRRHRRPSARVRRRADRLHRGVAPVRARLERGLADRRALAAGARRRDDHARRALDPQHDLRGGQGAERRTRRVGRGRRVRRRRRRAARGRPHRRAQLGVDLLRQRPRRSGRARARADPAEREPRRARQELRRAGRGARHERARRARLRAHARQPLRLGLGRDDRPLHRRRRRCSARSSSGSRGRPSR